MGYNKTVVVWVFGLQMNCCLRPLATVYLHGQQIVCCPQTQSTTVCYDHAREETRDSHQSVFDLQSKMRFAESWMLEIMFSHMRLRKPTGSLVLDRSIRDGDLARGILALPSKSKQINAALIVGIVPLRLCPWRHNTNAIFPATSKLRLAFIAVALYSWTSSNKHTT